MAWTSSSGGAAGSRTHSRAYSARAAPARAQADTAEDKSSSPHQKTLSSASTAKRAMRPMDVPHPPRPSGDAAAAAAVTPQVHSIDRAKWADLRAAHRKRTDPRPRHRDPREIRPRTG